MTRALVRSLALFGGAALLVAALILGVGATAHSTASHTPVSRAQLPDLDQETPSGLEVRAAVSGGRRTYRLGFRSAVRNIGAGPLIVDGRLEGSCSSPVGCSADGTPTMAADQLIEAEGPSQEVVRGVGWLRFVRSADHDHWHLIGFDRYELRRAGSAAVLVRDRKSGFCLGDRYPVRTHVLPAAPPQPVYTGRCGLAHPGLVHMREGISVGYGDDYAAYLEYQDLPLDGLANGRYVLVHRVNGDRRLRELSYANNAASVLLDLRWQSGVPYLSVLATCPDTDRCDRPARGA
jgi:hypothetical protein